MLINDDALYLYNLTLKPGSYYTQSIVGQFYNTLEGKKKSQQLILVSPSTLQLFEIHPESGKLQLKASQNLLGTVNKVEKITIEEGHDSLVVSSDSGNLSILEYSTKDEKFVSKVQEPMTKNGWSKTYVGEYLAVDPENRCVLVSAMERNKLIYKIESKELSSPLESSIKGLLTLDIVPLNTDHGNPLFGALEINPDKEVVLNYYELDRGLNHIVKKRPTVAEKLPSDASHLIALPGHIGGMLVCGTNWLLYERIDSLQRIYLPLPRRKGNQDSIIVNHVTHILKKQKFFILLQNTLGDLFKLVIDYDSDRDSIKDITITYFDTILPCLSLNIFKSGLLFANVLNNNRMLYQFEKLGDDLTEKDLVIKSSDYQDLKSVIKPVKPTAFDLKDLSNLALIDTLETLSPILDSKSIDSKLVTLSSHSYLKTVTHGIPTTTMVESPLPVIPTDIFTTKLSSDAANDEYLVISSSLSSKTVVLSIGEVVEDVEDSEFVLDQPTVAVQQVGKHSVVQIYTNGIKHVRQVKGEKKTTDWLPPAGITITHAATSNQQVLIALSNLEMVYFEVDPLDDQLVEYQERLELSTAVTSMAVEQSENPLTRSPFAIIGCSDETIQVVSLKQQNCLEVQSIQALSSNCSSLKMAKHDKDLMVHIGMNNGVYARIKIDPVNGKLFDSRSKYLGSKPVNLNIVKLPNGVSGILAISSKPWVSYFYKNEFKTTPLLDVSVTDGCSFVSEDIGGEAIVGISGNDLVIFSIGDEEDEGSFDLLQDFAITKTKLRYTPRKLLTHDDRLFVTETEYNTKGPYKSSINGDVKDTVDEEYYEAFGYERKANSWSSCVQVLSTKDLEMVLQTIEFKSNESIVSATVVTFDKNSTYLIVGVTTDQTFLPNSHGKSYLFTFKESKNKTLQFIHKTEVEEIPQVATSFQNKLLVASKNVIRLYELGQKQLLKKSTTVINFLANIIKILPQSNRIIISDSHSSSIVFAKYDVSENQFIAIADDIVKRQVVSIFELDTDTILTSDKFGNVSVSRLDEHISRQIDEDWTILKSSESVLNSCPFKLTNMADIYLGETITSFQFTNDEDKNSVLYCGIFGTLGALTPLVSKSEVELLINLQLEMRKVGGNELGKDHLKFRSYYNPVKNVIDGDLLEKFHELSRTAKQDVAKTLNKNVNDIEKKLVDLRNRSFVSIG
ncbi:Pre-mRNA-splicing factor RSE1 [Candida viswanathii]|uniref:Pre-mRNA-splicing factor RSE1 n=1 Tax=Candida viswanathii TaxID=5486 RepID=A0A367YPC3_9ASCO|nr:Pre-mRNA-splicing factor RSE1 [Candida viswanathii]